MSPRSNKDNVSTLLGFFSGQGVWTCTYVMCIQLCFLILYSINISLVWSYHPKISVKMRASSQRMNSLLLSRSERFLSLSVSAARTRTPVRSSHHRRLVICRQSTVMASLCVCPASRPALPPVGPGTLDSAATGIATLNIYIQFEATWI